MTHPPHAWTVNEFGPYRKVLSWQESEAPRPKGHEVLIRVAAAALNFSDILCIAGLYQVKPALPFTPGSEAVGVVVAAGDDANLQVGDRVVCVDLTGAFGHHMLVEEVRCLPVGGEIPDQDAAAMTITYQTAHFALAHRARLRPGEVVLVHGAAGGVGLATVQLAKALGATVIATAGSEQKLRVCRDHGADHVIDYVSSDFRDEVMRITGGRGVDVAIDPVGGEVFEGTLRCMATEGRLVTIGFTSGTIPTVPVNHILLKNISIVGLFWGPYLMEEPGRVRETQETLYDLYMEGTIAPVVSKTLQLSQLPSGLDLLASRRSYGKIVVVPD